MKKKILFLVILGLFLLLPSLVLADCVNIGGFSRFSLRGLPSFFMRVQALLPGSIFRIAKSDPHPGSIPSKPMSVTETRF